jgi:hypothetical protein
MVAAETVAVAEVAPADPTVVVEMVAVVVVTAEAVVST